VLAPLALGNAILQYPNKKQDSLDQPSLGWPRAYVSLAKAGQEKRKKPKGRVRAALRLFCMFFRVFG
jgi:hypothetical protein